MNRQAPPFADRVVGLALGSGGARGMAHIGVLDALESKRIRIDHIAGTSIGALIGALYASGVSVVQLQKIANELNWRSLSRLLGPVFPTTGLLDSRKITHFIDDLLPVKTFEDLLIPLAVTATDIESGDSIVIRNGLLLPAIQAAIAFPGLFQPVAFGDRFLVDGGLCAPVPTDVVRQMGAEFIIGVCAIPPVSKRYMETSAAVTAGQILTKTSTDRLTVAWIEQRFREIWQSTPDTPPVETNRRAPGIFRVFAQSVAILENQINTLRLEKDTVDLLIRPELNGMTLLEFHRAAEAIAAGRSATIGALSQLTTEMAIAETLSCDTMQKHGITDKKEDLP